ncbi:hypothetical protein BAY61_23630 [Prauserella marina]|uniref:Uncharacterized protein n=1 Tax=Prauserella marina TaxID=530584 RepID=A0A222VU72_9PSEU|nr:hypothetical protein [Prauserella marina]ASR37496.1 hypothetical protein BAY61_23630 [Prauserella marina]PWV74606.1 hypothetical protein DES30_1074 [Prauserella marina]SDD45460.1 hypothetical protein SAMN05421630_108247 [Prauserella marina]
MEKTRLLRLVELAFPGFVVGLVAGAVAGGLAGFVGQPAGWALVSMLTLGIPLGLFGAGFGLLVAFRKVRLGGFAPVALFWLAGFPVSRLLHEVGTFWILGGEPRLPPDLLGFLAYQGIVSAGFAIGFLWLHERLAPRWWRRMAPHNPEAARIYAAYAEHAKQIYNMRQARRESRAAKAKAAQR